MGFNDKGTKPKLFIGIGIIIILVIVVVIFVFGARGIMKVFGTVSAVLLVLATLFTLAWLFWFLFIKKERFDVTYVNKKKLIEAAKINYVKGTMGDLFLSGDAGHSRVRLGKILGFVRIQILKRTNKYDADGNMIMKRTVNPDEEPQPDYELDNEEQDVFTVKKGLGLFSDPMVIRVTPSQHDNLIGDVTLKGFSIAPHSEYWFLNLDYLDVRKIDFAILKEAERGIMFENLRDMKTIVDRSIGLDSDHKKTIEKKNFVEIPDQNQGQRN